MSSAGISEASLRNGQDQDQTDTTYKQYVSRPGFCIQLLWT